MAGLNRIGLVSKGPPEQPRDPCLHDNSHRPFVAMGETDVGRAICPSVDDIRDAASLPALQKCIQEAQGALTVGHFHYQPLHGNGLEGKASLSLSTKPKPWTAEYEARKVAEWDPTVRAARQSIAPIRWHELDWTSPDARRYRIMLERHAISTLGLTIPLHSPTGEAALFSVTAKTIMPSAWAAFLHQHESTVALLALRIHDRALSLSQRKAGSGEVSLTKQAKACLALLAQGKKPAQIATELDLSVHTVRKHLNGAVEALSCRTKADAISRAIILGLIRTQRAVAVNLIAFSILTERLVDSIEWVDFMM